MLGVVPVFYAAIVPNHAHTHRYLTVDMGRFRNCSSLLPFKQQRLPTFLLTLGYDGRFPHHTRLFFLYFFIKAVRETRDLHVETHHIHEDVRVMEASMREHSLSGWMLVCLAWTAGAMLSAWTGAHYIAERTGSRTWALVLHLLFSVITIPLMVWTIWFPQKMLGNEARVRTKAAVTAEEDLMSKASLVEVSPDEEAW